MSEKHDEYHNPELDSETIASLLEPAAKNSLAKAAKPSLKLTCKVVEFLADTELPITCYQVPGQDPACKLPDTSELPANLRGLYLIDPGLTNLYAIQAALQVGAQACYYWFSEGRSPSVTVSGMSSRKFSDTRPNTPTSQHNFGKAFDVKLQGIMKSNGASYDPVKCAYLCLYCALAGASKVFFSDQAVVDAVNKVLKDNGKPQVCQNIASHENHIHMDMR